MASPKQPRPFNLIKRLYLAAAVALMLGCVSCTGPTETNVRLGRCSVSPDGHTVYFTIYATVPIRSGSTSDIYSAKFDGSGLKQLTTGPGLKNSPWVSPDGRSVVYNSSGHVFVMDSDGRNQRQLTYGGLGDLEPSFSRDGKNIIFIRSAEYRPYSMGGMVSDQWDIWEVNADGSGIRQLTFEKYYNIGAPYFSPDGKHVLFAAEVGKAFASRHILLTLDIEKDGSAGPPKPVPVPIVPSKEDYDCHPSFSPDGLKIVFSAPSTDPADPYGYEIWTVGVDGTNLRQLTHNKSRNMDPIYSPNGQFIYYWINDLWRMKADGSDQRSFDEWGRG